MEIANHTDNVNLPLVPPGAPPGGPPPPPGPFMPTYIIILADTLMLFIGGTVNIGTIAAFWCDVKVRAKASDLIILALAIADSYICLVVMPLDIAEKATGQWFLGETGCRIKFILEPGCVTAGINLIVILSWDRYLMLAKDYSAYMKIQQKPMILKLIAAAWVYALVPGIVENATWTYLNDLPVPPGGIPAPDYAIICVPPSARSPKYQLIFVLLLRIIPITLVLIFGVLFLVRLRRRLLQWKRVGHNVMVSAVSSVNTATTSSSVNTATTSSTGGNHGDLTTGGADGSKIGQNFELSESNANTDGSKCSAESPNCSNKNSNEGGESNENNSIIELSEDNPSSKNSNHGNQEASQPGNSQNNQSSVATLTVPTNIKHNKSIQKEKATDRPEPSTLKPIDKEAAILRKRYIKPTITYATLVLALFICTTPSHIYILHTLLTCNTCFQPIIAETFKLLVFCNSCINPILYAVTNKKIRQFYRRVLRGIYRW